LILHFRSITELGRPGLYCPGNLRAGPGPPDIWQAGFYAIGTGILKVKEGGFLKKRGKFLLKKKQWRILEII
jgi:hypothetical protein